MPPAANAQTVPNAGRGPSARRAMPVPSQTVWFRLNVGRERNADPKWLLPEICKQGDITKQDIGQIRIFDRDTRFEVDANIADAFAERVASPRRPACASSVCAAKRRARMTSRR